MLQPTYPIPSLPSLAEIETPSVLRATALAHRHLAELKGRAVSVPNPTILIETLTLQEAWASCEIENIVTTQDELYRANLFPDSMLDPAAKEVASYRTAVKRGFTRLQETDNQLTNDLLIDVYRVVKSRADGFRVTPGTVILNTFTEEVVHVPPQDPAEIVKTMGDLERFANDDGLSSLDPLVKMAVIHHQFESIHPFPDGNGRVGRILCVLYLVRCGLLETPILYLSRAIMRSKGQYYHRLQAVRDEGAWEDWLLYMLDAVQSTSRHTLALVERIRALMAEYKEKMRSSLPRIYSHELLNNIFRHPYTRIDSVQRDVKVSRPTAARYLNLLANEGLVSKRRAGKASYYVNEDLVDLLRDPEIDAIGQRILQHHRE